MSEELDTPIDSFGNGNTTSRSGMLTYLIIIILYIYIYIYTLYIVHKFVVIIACCNIFIIISVVPLNTCTKFLLVIPSVSIFKCESKYYLILHSSNK